MYLSPLKPLNANVVALRGRPARLGGAAASLRALRHEPQQQRHHAAPREVGGVAGNLPVALDVIISVNYDKKLSR